MTAPLRQLLVSSRYGISAGSAPAYPEPSTWAVLAMGFLGLAGVGIKRRRKAAAMAEKL